MQQLPEINKYNQKDLEFIYSLNVQLIDMPWDMQSLSSTIDDNNSLCFVADAVGFILARQVIDEAEILLLAVSANHQNEGVASALLKRCLVNLMSSGVKTIFLEVSENNNPAINFYKKHKFVQSGFRKDYYKLPDNTKASALLLSRPV